MYVPLQAVGDCDILPDEAQAAVSQAIANCGEDFTLETGFDVPADVAAEVGGDTTAPTETGDKTTTPTETGRETALPEGSGYSRKIFASIFLILASVALNGI